MLQTKMRFLARSDVYSAEKPYSADFAVDERNGAQRSNIITTHCDVQVIPIGSQNGFDMDVAGFCILNEDTSLTLEDALSRPQDVEVQYQAELEQIVHKYFPEYTRLEALDFVVSGSSARVIPSLTNYAGSTEASGLSLAESRSCKARTASCCGPY